MLRVKQVAERLNLSESKVYEMLERGELPHHRFGGAIRVSEDQIAEYLEETKRERREQEPRKSRPRPPSFDICDYRSRDHLRKVPARDGGDHFVLFPCSTSKANSSRLT